MAQEPGQALLTVDRFVPHASTVPANRGERVGLFVREKRSPETGQDDREILDAAVVDAYCDPGYESILASSETDWDEIDTVVDYIRELRDEDGARVSTALDSVAYRSTSIGFPT